MTIIVNLDVELARRKMKLNDLSELVGISVQNLSVLKTGKARAIRFSTLDKLCEVLECTPGDILEHRPDDG
jgi:putative transcriptional regulator